jgi:hypothetical protein
MFLFNLAYSDSGRLFEFRSRWLDYLDYVLVVLLLHEFLLLLLSLIFLLLYLLLLDVGGWSRLGDYFHLDGLDDLVELSGVVSVFINVEWKHLVDFLRDMWVQFIQVHLLEDTRIAGS